jgi:hypothetical protein
LFIATVIYTVVAALQWYVMRNTFRQSQRSWVNAECFVAKKIVLPPQGRFDVYGELTMKNTGISVATDGWASIVALPNKTAVLTKKWDSACVLVDRQIKASRESALQGFGDTWPIGFVLSPNQETSSMGFSIGEDFTPEDLRNGFYLVGCAKYVDQFKEHHVTRFCFTPDAAIYGPDMSVSKFGFKICNAFQSAD